MSHESLEGQSEFNFDYKKDKEYFGDLRSNNNGHGPYAFSQIDLHSQIDLFDEEDVFIEDLELMFDQNEIDLLTKEILKNTEQF